MRVAVLVVVLILFIGGAVALRKAAELPAGHVLEHPLASSKWTTADKCSKVCTQDVTWDWPEHACSQYGNTMQNQVCSSGWFSIFLCMSGAPKQPIGFSYPGLCGCPSYCFNSTGNGHCVEGACACAPGWTGADCSYVTTDNKCSGRGSVAEWDSVEYCECSTGSAMSDCSASVGPLPPIVQSLPSTQYSSWDDYGNSNPIFNDATIATIHLFMEPEELAWMQDPVNSESTTYLPCTFWFRNGYTSQYMEKIGIRIKGGASRVYNKKTWKLSFNEYDDDEDWEQQTKLVLKAMQMSPAAIREKLTIGLLYSMDAKVQRAAYAEVFINDKFMGMYLMLEDIGNRFLKSRFGNDDGALYKCSCGLEYQGSDPSVYANETDCYRPETDAAYDYTQFAEFITILNGTVEEVGESLESIFDVDLFLRTLVVEVATGNYDGIWNANNFYLYYNPDVSAFQYFRHDLDLAFGVMDTYFLLSSRDIYAWGVDAPGHVLINKVLAVDKFREAYTNYWYLIMDTYFNTRGPLAAMANALTLQVAAGLQRDHWRYLDMDFNYLQALAQQYYPIERSANLWWPSTQNITSSSTMGIVPFIRDRTAYTLQQIAPQ